MNRCGLNGPDFNSYLGACALPHQVEISVDLRNDAGEVLVSFDGGSGGGRNVVVTDGSVAVDATTPVGRVLTLTVADPDKVLLVGEDANYTNRQLQVSVGVHTAPLGKVVWCTIFTGPIVSAPRSGDVIQFTAHGKARYALHGVFPKYVVPKGTRKTTAIRRILHDLAGEPYSTMGGVPDLAAKLVRPLTINLTDSPWGVCRRLAAGMSRHLQFDGPGDLRMQRVDLTEPVFTFHGTDEPGTRFLVEPPPEAWTDWSKIKNIVRATGGKTHTSRAPVVYANADDLFPGNPFSPTRRGRNGAPSYFWDNVKHKHVHSAKTLQKIANETLARDMIANRAYKFQSIPIYVFDEMDLVAIDTLEVVGQTHLQQFVIPLNLDGAPTMPYGFTRRVSSNAFGDSR